MDKVASGPGRYAAARNGKRPVYGLYGLSLASDFTFANRLAEGAEPPSVSFSCVTDEPPTVCWDECPPVYASSARLGSGRSCLYVYRQRSYYLLRFTGIADYYLWPERIVCHLLDPAYDYLVEINLLGLAFSVWLELQGIPALHASAVAIKDRAALFLSTNDGGKSSLAASLLQAGYPLLSDDVLPVERRGEVFWGRPGYPQMRMWPDQARHFLGHYKDLGVVHPAYSKRRVPVGKNGLGSFCDVPRPLACLYILERRDPDDCGTGVEIETISGVEALVSLIGGAFAPPIVETLGLEAYRLGFFSSLVSQVPIRRLLYPNGFDHLPRVRSAILNDLASTHLSESEGSWLT